MEQSVMHDSSPGAGPDFLSPALLEPLAVRVGAYLNRCWAAVSAQDLSELACHPCAIVSDGSTEVFVKFSADGDAVRQFEIEASSLEYLAAQAGVSTPAPIGVVPVAHGTLFVMEALKPVEREREQWRAIGTALAQIHRVHGNHFGFSTDNYFGPLEQDNSQVDDWATFYGEYRLRPRLKLAVDSGHLPADLAAKVEAIIARLPELCGPPVTPTLLHGDAQQNNFVSTATGTYVIDPAIHYGHPELDLAYLDTFQPVPDDVLQAYSAELAIDPGFNGRRSLWHISSYLAAVAVEGSWYLKPLAKAVQRYL